MQDTIRARVAQLQQERQQTAERLQQLAAEMERQRLTLAAYDGAIGELSALLQTAQQDATEEPNATE
jgi:ABC-type phosphate transport system auxiliary subunit